MIVLYAEHAFAPTSAFLALWIGLPGADALARAAGSAAGAGPDRRRGQALPPPPGAPDLALFRRSGQYAETNWLPPDNSQLALRVEVAQRTSPTNIGLWLTSALAARGFRVSHRHRFREPLHADDGNARTAWNATKDIFSTGTTPTRWSR